MRSTQKFHTNFKSTIKITANTTTNTNITNERTKQIENDLAIPTHFNQTQKQTTQRPSSQRPYSQYSQNQKPIVLKQVHLHNEESLKLKREKVKKELETKSDQVIELDNSDDFNFSSELLDKLVQENDVKIDPLTTSSSTTGSNNNNGNNNLNRNNNNNINNNNRKNEQNPIKSNSLSPSSSKYDLPKKKDSKDIRLMKKDKEEIKRSPLKQQTKKMNQSNMKQTNNTNNLNDNFNTQSYNQENHFINDYNSKESEGNLQRKESVDLRSQINNNSTSVTVSQLSNNSNNLNNSNTFNSQQQRTPKIVLKSTQQQSHMILSPIKRDEENENQMIMKSNQVEESLEREKKELIKTTSASISKSIESNRMTTSYMEEEGKQMNSAEVKQILDSCCQYFHEGYTRITCQDMYDCIKMMVNSENNEEVLDKLVELTQCPLFRFMILEEAHIINETYDNLYIEKQNQFYQSQTPQTQIMSQVPFSERKGMNIVDTYLSSKDHDIQKCLLTSLFHILNVLSDEEDETNLKTSNTSILQRSLNEQHQIEIIDCDTEFETSIQNNKSMMQRQQSLVSKELYSPYIITEEIQQDKHKMKLIRKKNKTIEILQGIFTVYPTILREIYEYIIRERNNKRLTEKIVIQILEFSTLYDCDCSLLQRYKEYIIKQVCKHHQTIDLEWYLNGIVNIVSSSDSWQFEQYFISQFIDFLIGLLQTNINTTIIEFVLIILNKLLWIDDGAFLIHNQIDLLNYKMELEMMEYDDKIKEFITILDEITSELGGNV